MTKEELERTVEVLRDLAMHTPEGRAAFVQAGLGSYGIWCVQDAAWCPVTKPFRGSKSEAEAEIVHWRSGYRADVEPGAFTYEVRPA